MTEEATDPWASLKVEPAREQFSEDLVRGLPAAARRYLLHAIAPATPLASSVRLAMRGSIKPGGAMPWMRFTAQQILTPERGFVWKVKARWGPFVIIGVDRYCQGEGRTLMKLFGLVSVVDAGGPDVSKSALGRLAAESVLVPSTLLPREAVRWEAVDEGRARVHLTVDGEPTALTLSVDAEGRLRQVVVQRWGDQTESGEYDYIPFGVALDEERAFEGFTIPSQLRAGWWFGTERYAEFFRARIETALFD